MSEILPKFPLYAEIFLTLSIPGKFGLIDRTIPVCGETNHAIERMRDCLVAGVQHKGFTVEHSRIVYPEVSRGN